MQEDPVLENNSYYLLKDMNKLLADPPNNTARRHKLYITYLELLNNELPKFEKICDIPTATAFTDQLLGVFGYKY